MCVFHDDVLLVQLYLKHGPNWYIYQSFYDQMILKWPNNVEECQKGSLGSVYLELS